MLTWLIKLFKGTPTASKHKRSVLMDVMGYNKSEILLKPSEFPCECMECGTQWDNRTPDMYGNSNTLKLFERCSKCLDICTIDQKDVKVYMDGKRVGINIEGLGINDVAR